jgi:methyl-accepting chemotaxis protein
MIAAIRTYFLKNKQRRLRNFVLSSKQLWISAAVCSVSLASMAVVFIVARGVFHTFAQTLADLQGDAGVIVMETFEDSSSTLLQISAIFAFIFSMLVFICTIMLTHRVYGPAVALKRQLKKMQDNDFENKIKLRKHDELKDVAAELNKLSDAIANRQS